MGVRACFQCLVDFIQKEGEIERFFDVCPEPDRERFFDIRLHGVGADGDDGNVPGFLMRAQALERFDAVHFGKIDVHEDEVRPVRPCQVDADLRLRRFEKPDILFGFEDLLDQRQVGRVVFYIQYREPIGSVGLRILCDRPQFFLSEPGFFSLREFEREGAALSRRAAERDGALHVIHQPLRDGEADAGPFDF